MSVGPVTKPSIFDGLGRTIVNGVALAVIALGAAWAYHEFVVPAPPPSPEAPTVDAVKMGRAYQPMIAEAAAKGWDAHGVAMVAGKSLEDAEKAYQAAQFEARTKSWMTSVRPLVQPGIFPAESKDLTPEQRAAIVRFGADFAKGLRGKR